MRDLVIALGLSLLASLLPDRGAAFETEQFLLFDADQPTETLRILSTTDPYLFAPLLTAFQEQAPGVSIEYYLVSSAELIVALDEGDVAFDLAISSAMDLQTRLANDGRARSHQSDVTALLPDWARWRDQIFAFTLEPATIVLSRADFADLPIPRTRQELISVLRDNADRFRDRIGTYDIRASGLGYLFATQDGRTSETYWRLAEVMGSLNTRLYCCSSDMIDDVISGEIAVAYNVLGSYANARSDAHDRIEIIEPEDFTTMMLRTVLIPDSASRPALAAGFVDFLLLSAWTDRGSDSFPFPGTDPDVMASNPALRPIQLGPGLLVYLDRLKRREFIAEWESATLQPG